MKLLTFKQAIKIALKSPKHLLLGNGFSQACFDVFSYENLFHQGCHRRLLEENGVSENGIKTFETLQTNDFEQVIDGLQKGARVVANYSCLIDDQAAEILPSQLKKDAEAIRRILANTIASKHPRNPNEINSDQYYACAQFLGKFNSIFTLNYDLLLYWVMMKQNKLKFRDGFRFPKNREEKFVEWSFDDEKFPNVFYLHGGLHLFVQSDSSIKKLTWRGDIPLKERILSEMDGNSYPLFVAEGTARDKRSRIGRSAYLTRAHRALEQICGSLFVYGASLKDNDEHILRAIANSKIQQLFVGIWDLDGEEKNLLAQRSEKIKELRKGCAKKMKQINSGNPENIDIYYYKAKSAKIWG